MVQIETLRLKVDVDKRQHDRKTSGVMSDTERKVKLRDLEIENLRSELNKRDGALKVLCSSVFCPHIMVKDISASVNKNELFTVSE